MGITKTKRPVFSKDINTQLHALSVLDNWHACMALCQDYLIIGGIIFLCIDNPYLYPIALLIIGSRQGALANLAHEAGHGRLTKNRKLNYFIGTYLTGYLIFQEMSTFIDSHVKAHHIYLGDKQKDPDYSYHIQVGLYESQDRKTFISKYILKPLYLNSVFHYMKNIFANRAPTFSKYKYQAFIMTTYLISMLIILGYFGYFKYFLIFWVVPFFTIFPTIGWFVDFVEHYPLVGENKDIMYMTRNRFSHPIEHFLFNIHNENYHLVHHLRPDIPFWNLKKAHRILLKDSDYKLANEKMGGIFLSSNSQNSFIKNIMHQSRKISGNGIKEELNV